jgi:phosphopantothenoylcysteine synthetase/decarboxylase
MTMAKGRSAVSNATSTGTVRRRARRVLLCATGGYQCYALPGFVLSLLRHFADDVQVVLSRAAAGMVSRKAVEVATRHPVFVEMDDTSSDVFVPHIELGRDVDLVLVYPATVNVVAKVAHGVADELIPALILATPAPVFFVPVANPLMWNHPASRRNLKTLRDDGYVVLPPLPGVEVATREGLDELADPFPLPTLLARMASALQASSKPGVPRREEAE